jgi:hypothetical protein
MYKFERINELNLNTFNNELNYIEELNKKKNKMILNDHFINPHLLFTIGSLIQTKINEENNCENENSIPIISNIDRIFKSKIQKETQKKGSYGYIKICNLCPNYKIVLKLIKKKIDPIIGIYDILHEYLIAVNGLNLLRNYCPNFCYSFGIVYSQTHKEIIHLMEYNNGFSITDYIEENKLKTYNDKLGKIFFQILIQVICSLELAQDLLFFTHYDLHLDNILIKHLNNEIELIYPCKFFSIKLKNINYIAQIIDFGFSTIILNNQIYGKNNINIFPELGMYPFFIPGLDLIKLFSSLYYQLHNNIVSTSLNHIIYSFIKYILINFFQLEINDKLIDVKLIGTHVTKSVYKSPFELLLFLLDDKNKKFIIDLFKFDEYPFEIIDNYEFKKFNLEDDLSLQNCIQNYLQIDLIKSKYNFNLLISNFKYDLNIFKIILDKFKNVKLPYININNLKEIKNYISDKNWIIYNQQIENLLMDIKNNFQFSNEIYDYIYKNKGDLIKYYYIYKTLYFFNLYIKDTIKIIF